MATKQIRSGRVESIIRVLEAKLESYEELKKQFDEMGGIIITGRINEIESCLELLREAIK